jgi:hypothetical protein
MPGHESHGWFTNVKHRQAMQGEEMLLNTVLGCMHGRDTD